VGSAALLSRLSKNHSCIHTQALGCSVCVAKLRLKLRRKGLNALLRRGRHERAAPMARVTSACVRLTFFMYAHNTAGLILFSRYLRNCMCVRETRDTHAHSALTTLSKASSASRVRCLRRLWITERNFCFWSASDITLSMSVDTGWPAAFEDR
jgi:hypothetical protein